MSADAISPAVPSRRRLHGVVSKRLAGRRVDRMLIVGVGILVVVILGSAIGHFVLAAPNQQNLEEPLSSPSLAHPFGTDELGRDVLSRTLAATWLDLAFGIGVTLVAVSLGLAIGTLAGRRRGIVEGTTMRLVDAVVAFPPLVFMLGVIAIVGPGIEGLVIGAVLTGWAFYARLSRAEMLVLREKQFMQAAETLGYGSARVVGRHAIPNLLRPAAVYSMSDVVFNILTIAALSFLGVGVVPPTPEWGAIIAGGQNYLLTAWWISTLPGFFVVLVGLGFVLIGDALSEILGIRSEPLP